MPQSITDEQIEAELLQDDLIFLGQAIGQFTRTQNPTDFAAVRSLIDKLALDLGLYQDYYKRAIGDLEGMGLKIALGNF